MFGVVVIYVVLGNYLYFSKILPALDESPKLLPSGQLRDVDRYLKWLEKTGECPWFAVLLRNIRLITIVYLVGFAVMAILILSEF